jgi:hypothetical protein
MIIVRRGMFVLEIPVEDPFSLILIVNKGEFVEETPMIWSGISVIIGL